MKIGLDGFWRPAGRVGAPLVANNSSAGYQRFDAFPRSVIVGEQLLCGHTPVAMSTVRTRPWPDLLAELVEHDPTSRYSSLVRFIAQSDFSNELHGGLFLSGLLLSDSPDFKFNVHMLRVQGVGPDQFKISYFRGIRGGFKDDAEKICAGEELVATVDLFVKVKFGIALSLRRANG